MGEMEGDCRSMAKLALLTLKEGHFAQDREMANSKM